MAKSFLKNAGNYGIGTILVTLAGFISFPLLTRTFDVAEYGMFSLVSGTLAFLVGASKLGFNHSTVRYYSEVKAGRTQWGMDNYYSTIYLGVLLLAMIVTAAWLVVNYFFGQRIWQNDTLVTLFMVTSVLVIAQSMESSLINILKAQERSAEYSVYKVTKKYVVLASMVAAIAIFGADLVAFYIALAASEWLVLIYFTIRWAPLRQIRPQWLDRKMMAALMAFGIPMFGVEMSAVLLNIGDRYVINALLEQEALGVYSAAYTLCEYARDIVANSLAYSALPMFLRIYAEQDEQAAKAFIRNAIGTYAWIMVPIAFGLSAVAPQVIEILAGERYVAGAELVPWLAGGLALSGGFSLVGAGLYLAKASRKLFLIFFFAAVSNVAINIAVLPILGIVGAAMSSFACMTLLVVAAYVVSQRYVRVNLPLKNLFCALLAGALMYLGLLFIHIDNLWLLFGVKVAAGVVIYTVALLALDSDARGYARKVIGK